MSKIKVIGDIRSGKYQPTLTGNAIVDAALIAHFCQQLASALKLSEKQVQPDHHWNLTIDSQTVYVVEQQIWHAQPFLSHHPNVIPVSGSDLQRGQVTATCHQITALLAHHSHSCR